MRIPQGIDESPLKSFRPGVWIQMHFSWLWWMWGSGWVPLSYSLPENVNGHGLLEGGDGVHHSFPNGNDEAPSQILQGRKGSSKHLYRLGWVVWDSGKVPHSFFESVVNVPSGCLRVGTRVAMHCSRVALMIHVPFDSRKEWLSIPCIG